jgi:type III restriction enzyme
MPARIAWNAAALVHGDAPPGCMRLLSEVTALRMHSGHSMPVDKCIYSRLPLSRHNAACERDFLAWVQEDRGVEAFCRLDRRHAFLRVGGHQGHLGGAPPDFLLRTPIAVYLVDLHARRGSFPRLQAMMEWCTRANALPPAWRGERAWFFAPLAGLPLEDWHRRGARLGELLAFSRAQAGYVAPPGSTPWH